MKKYSFKEEICLPMEHLGVFFVRPDRIGIWKCCNKRRFNLQDRKKLFRRKLLIPSRNIYVTWFILWITWQNVSLDRNFGALQNMSMASLNLLLNLSSSLVRIEEEDKVWPDFRWSPTAVVDAPESHSKRSSCLPKVEILTAFALNFVHHSTFLFPGCQIFGVDQMQ